MTTDQRIGEVAAPWYLRQAEFDGVHLALADDSVPAPGHTRAGGFRYQVGWQVGVLGICPACKGAHLRYATIEYDGDSLEEAEAAYADLEAKLLAGELR